MDNSNEALSDLATMFVNYPENPTPGHHLVDKSRLDFTPDSLSYLDDHIEEMRSQKLSDDQWNVFILRSGAYVGEMIRRMSQPDTNWQWMSYEQASLVSDMVRQADKNISTVAVLWDGADGLIFPLGKITKFIENGREDSVHFYAHVISKLASSDE
ncbi:MAG: hypothetical protein AAFN77_24475 [Planctomycetota bacterium]